MDSLEQCGEEEKGRRNFFIILRLDLYKLAVSEIQNEFMLYQLNKG